MAEHTLVPKRHHFQYPNTRYRDDNSLVWWAIVASIALHILLAYVIPKIEYEQPDIKQILTIALSAPSPAQPVVNPQPATETPPTPEVKKSEPVTKPEPRLKLPPLPSPVAEPSATSAPEVEAKPQQPAVMATEAREDAKPAFVAPASQPEAPKPAAPPQQDVSDARNQYGDMLTRQIAKYKQYPRIAQMRGWEGSVVLELQLDANGNLTSSRIYQSSNREALDQQALEMVKKASPFPLPPAALRGRSFSILVPVSFKLE
ncbi:MAG: TonB family protein [Methylophilaceae bacterium]